jgi:hypothetical protein
VNLSLSCLGFFFVFLFQLLVAFTINLRFHVFFLIGKALWITILHNLTFNSIQKRDFIFGRFDKSSINITLRSSLFLIISISIFALFIDNMTAYRSHVWKIKLRFSFWIPIKIFLTCFSFYIRRKHLVLSVKVWNIIFGFNNFMRVLLVEIVETIFGMSHAHVLQAFLQFIMIFFLGSD